MAEAFHITTRTIDALTLVGLAGEFDLAARADLERVLGQALTGPPGSAVVVDLAEARLIDSTTVAVLVAARRDAAEQGVGLTVANARGLVAQVLRMTGVYDTLTRPTAVVPPLTGTDQS